MNTYSVTVTKVGTLFATVSVSADNALAACNKAEAFINARPERVQLSDGGKVYSAMWSGYDFQARRVM